MASVVALKKMLIALVYKTIVSTRKLYEWARDFFKKIDFDVCTLDEYKKHQKMLEKRFAKAKTINGTRKFHCFKPSDSNFIECKIVSSHLESTRVEVIKK